MPVTLYDQNFDTLTPPTADPGDGLVLTGAWQSSTTEKFTTPNSLKFSGSGAASLSTEAFPTTTNNKIRGTVRFLTGIGTLVQWYCELLFYNAAKTHYAEVVLDFNNFAPANFGIQIHEGGHAENDTRIGDDTTFIQQEWYKLDAEIDIDTSSINFYCTRGSDGKYLKPDGTWQVGSIVAYNGPIVNTDLDHVEISVTGNAGNGCSIYVDDLFSEDTSGVSPLDGGTIQTVLVGATKAEFSNNVSASGGVAPLVTSWEYDDGGGTFAVLTGETDPLNVIVDVLPNIPAQRVRRVTTDDDLTVEYSNVITFQPNDVLDVGVIDYSNLTGTSVHINFTTPVTGGDENYSYQLQIDDGSGFVDVVGQTDDTGIASGLSLSTPYDLRFYVEDGEGTNGYTNTVSITTLATMPRRISRIGSANGITTFGIVIMDSQGFVFDGTFDIDDLPVFIEPVSDITDYIQPMSEINSSKVYGYDIPDNWPAGLYDIAYFDGDSYQSSGQLDVRDFATGGSGPTTAEIVAAIDADSTQLEVILTAIAGLPTAEENGDDITGRLVFRIIAQLLGGKFRIVTIDETTAHIQIASETDTDFSDLLITLVDTLDENGFIVQQEPLP